ncbi:CocE/NonD family hydrolase [Halocynthiibacter styelae]|uniref:CocE/NonD family hydrolase n=1 Tax=Halocynthiibacter styelae TaxID=2761955 RepID=A0A8J7IYT8_9RHOB|nr:CocE/NonD family hydrolase [Paenihalocynthiibacter styelae]MBI1494785.1 CocE/NonD family hydrolase [Paenihalocynthiibacter styelae]
MSQPHNVTIDRDMGIALPDGTRLSAQVWMPDGPGPFPAILEYLPYRKSDGTAARDHGMHLAFAQQGYVSIRVDRRGTGDSEGSFDDEYSEEELSDGEDIIAWIADQTWCNGNVGIQGISWGGFNGLQLAARRPPALKAVISIGTTVNRYTDDIHYKGGIQLSENIGWVATATSWNSMPPDPALIENWREIWLKRLENAPNLGKIWTEHKNRDDYWKHGSVCEDYSVITTPTLIMGGQLDGYRNAMSELVENGPGVVKGVLGPWNHKYPHISTISPATDYIGDALNWWDRWLKGVENSAENDPAYRAYIMDSCTPDPALKARPGRWVSEADWPSDNVTVQTHKLCDAPQKITTDLLCGQGCGEYFPFGFGPGELPDDQTADNARSLCFDVSVPETTDILGASTVNLTIAADQPRAQVVVRLCDERPDGTSALITLGMLNLRHHQGSDTMRDLTPGEPVTVSIPLDHSAYRLPAGHKLRVAISPSYWPYAWPEAAPATLTVHKASLTLPCRKTIADSDEWHYDTPRPMEARDIQMNEIGKEEKQRKTDPITGESTLVIRSGRNEVTDQINDLTTGSEMSEIWTIHPDNPASARVEIIWQRWLKRDGVTAHSHLVTRQTTSADHFHIEQDFTVSENGEQVFQRMTKDDIAR